MSNDKIEKELGRNILYLFENAYIYIRVSLVAQSVKNSDAMQETQVWFLDGEHPLEKEIATHFSSLAWEIPWTEETGGLQSMGSQELDLTYCPNHHHHRSQCCHVGLFAAPWTAAHQAPLPMEFSRQEYWSGLSFSTPRDLLHPGIKSGSPALSPALVGGFFITRATWETHPHDIYIYIFNLTNENTIKQ